MIIKQARFITSLANYGPYPELGPPEIAICGKSNVGKSSLINRLTRHSKLAKISGTPGKTRLINLFAINDDFTLVDLPGYGFARVSKSEKLRWQDMIEGYFQKTVLLRHVLHLVDIRHDPTNDDINMHRFLLETGIPYTVIATKADKISRAARMRHIHAVCRGLAVQPWQVIPWSSEQDTGREELLDVLQKVIEEAGEDEGLDT